MIKRIYNFETANIIRLYAKFNKNSEICDACTSALGVIKYVKIFWCVKLTHDFLCRKGAEFGRLN